LQIVETYSSTRQISLELANLIKNTSLALMSNMWTVPPLLSQHIGDVIIHSAVPARVHGYVSLVTNVSDADGIVEVDVEFSDEPGLFHGPSNGLHFGTVCRDGSDLPRKLPVQLISRSCNATLKSIVVSCKPNSDCPSFSAALSVKSLQPTADWRTVGSLTLQSWHTIPVNTSHINSTVHVVYRCGKGSEQRLEIPFDMDISTSYAKCANLPLLMQPVTRLFLVNGPPFLPQNKSLTVVNMHSSPVQITGLSFLSDVSGLFSVVGRKKVCAGQTTATHV